MRALVRWFRYLRGLSARMDQIAEEMYYEQAERDGVEHPPPWRGR